MYRRKAQGWLKHADFFLIEIICFQMAFLLAFVMRHGFLNPYDSILYRNVSLVSALIQIFTLTVFPIFHNIIRRGYYLEFLSTMKTVGIVMFSIVFYLFATRQGGAFSRIVLVAVGGYYWAFSYLFRGLWKYFLRTRAVTNKGRKSMVIITAAERAEEIISLIHRQNAGEFYLSGIILTDRAAKICKIRGVPVVADRDSAAEYICRDWVDEVFFDVSETDLFWQTFMSIMIDMNMVIHLRVGYAGGFAGQKKQLQKIGEYIVVTMSANMLSARGAFFKRLMDIAGGLAGCFAAGILFIVLAPVIYYQSPGPIFFSQLRVGHNGKLFRIYKFRSMYMDAEERKKDLTCQNEVTDGMMFKMENDPRIIGSEKGVGKGIGNFIRRTSLDEFPQFFNVLKGDMSLVGTRPPTVDEWEKYDFHHRSRMSVKPGLTGMWQISGRSSVTDFEEVVALDVKYMMEWSIGLDVKILLQTVAAVAGKKGAR